MTIDFLLKHTSLKRMDANTKLYGIWYSALYYLIEYFIRRKLAKKFIERVMDDLMNYPLLKEVFVDMFKLSVSEDEIFLYVPFDEQLPQEVKNQTEPEQLMTLAESFFIEGTEYLRKDTPIMSTYMMNNMFQTLGMIEDAKTPFILLECDHIAYIMAIRNHFKKVVAFSIAQILLIISIVISILTII